MNTSHLAPHLQAVLKHMGEGVGFRVNDRKPGDLFKIITEKYTFTLIVVNPEKQEVVILGEEEIFREPKIYVLEGANWGGSMVKVGYVLTGCYVKVRSLTQGGFLLIPAVQGFAEFDGDPSEETKAIIAQAEANRPRAATAKEIDQMKLTFWAWVDEYDWGEHKTAVHEMIKRFCFPRGQMYIAGILVQALGAGKVLAALTLLEKQYNEHWYFRPDGFRGEIITPSDDYYLRSAYAELGLEPIGKEG